MFSTVSVSFEQFLTYLQTYLQNSTELTTHRCCHKRFCEVIPSDMSLKRLTVQHLRKFRDHMIGVGLSRKTIREYLNKTIRWIGYAWEQGQISQSTFLACQAIWMPNPRQGRPPIRTKPVKWSDIQQILPYLPLPIQQLIQLHWLTAARPNEIVKLNARELEQVRPDLTLWHLNDHKGSWRGEERTLFLGQAAMSILDTMSPSTNGYYFPSAKNKLGFLARLSYQRIVKRCTVNLVKDGILSHLPGWTLRGIRSGRARQIQQEHGLEAARILLGHNSQSMTSHYVGQSSATDELIRALTTN
ncbi:MAG: hypothetical protein EBR73_01425 [Rhodobacteraceae bacterium]|nr:hypothetical protein [Paracoccaceae bacterium]